MPAYVIGIEKACLHEILKRYNRKTKRTKLENAELEGISADSIPIPESLTILSGSDSHDDGEESDEEKSANSTSLDDSQTTDIPTSTSVAKITSPLGCSASSSLPHSNRPPSPPRSPRSARSSSPQSQVTRSPSPHANHSETDQPLTLFSFLALKNLEKLEPKLVEMGFTGKDDFDELEEEDILQLLKELDLNFMDRAKFRNLLHGKY